ncbi:MAG: hypothetical protein NVSMB1_03850 [Polyangiales bacterium]
MADGTKSTRRPTAVVVTVRPRLKNNREDEDAPKMPIVEVVEGVTERRSSVPGKPPTVSPSMPAAPLNVVALRTRLSLLENERDEQQKARDADADLIGQMMARVAQSEARTHALLLRVGERDDELKRLRGELTEQRTTTRARARPANEASQEAVGLDASEGDGPPPTRKVASRSSDSDDVEARVRGFEERAMQSEESARAAQRHAAQLAERAEFLESQVTLLETQARSAEERVREATGFSADVGKQSRLRDQRVSDLDCALATISEHLKAAEARAELAQSECEDLRAELDVARARIEAERRSYQLRNDALETERARSADLQTTIGVMESEHKELGALFARRLEESQNEMRVRLAEASDRVVALEETLAERTSAAMERSQALREELADAQVALEEREQQAVQRDAEHVEAITRLRAELEARQASAVEMERQSAEERKEAERSLERTAREFELKVSQLESDHAAREAILREEHRDLARNASATHAQAIAVLEDDLVRARADLAAARSQAEMAQHHAKMQHDQAQAALLESERRRSTEVSALQAQLDALTARVGQISVLGTKTTAILDALEREEASVALLRARASEASRALHHQLASFAGGVIQQPTDEAIEPTVLAPRRDSAPLKSVDEGESAELPRGEIPPSREGKPHVTREGARPPSPEGRRIGEFAEPLRGSTAPKPVVAMKEGSEEPAQSLQASTVDAAAPSDDDWESASPQKHEDSGTFIAATDAAKGSKAIISALAEKHRHKPNGKRRHRK